MNISIDELLEMWVKYTCQLWENKSVTKETINKLKEIRLKLNIYNLLFCKYQSGVCF
ncbi:hypothetical protein [Anaerophilus nitritogenes]|uniref:hypothetical protein n=1 Tax=Anaerophilus nitritogenes TaxID=2498136 RepID=UPI0013E9B73E|nr:hypothetical protein [Anaerophilus nitritogenes]